MRYGRKLEKESKKKETGRNVLSRFEEEEDFFRLCFERKMKNVRGGEKI
jgi:hypothetical protein